MYSRRLILGIGCMLVVGGCRTPEAEGCYTFDWAHDSSVARTSYQEAVHFDSVYLTRRLLPRPAEDTARSERFRVVTALENPDTATVTLGNLVFARTYRWYILFDASWEPVRRDSVRITLTHPGGHHRVITGQVTSEGLIGESRSYNHYRPGDYGDGKVEVFDLIDSSSFTARRIACPSRIHVFPPGWPR